MNKLDRKVQVWSLAATLKKYGRVVGEEGGGAFRHNCI